jgi:microcystin-dependent protein
MSNPFLAEIRIFPFNFAPVGWALCNGQLMAISQNTALFSLLGTTYGGNGTSNFALPNLQGSAPMQPGQGPGLSLHDLGETGGSDTVTLLRTENPSHNHLLAGDTANAASASPANAVYKFGRHTGTPVGAVWSYSSQNPDTSLNSAAIGITGGSQPHNNLMPYLTLNFCIALQGIYPSRN